MAATAERVLDQILEADSLRTLFQPIVSLDDGAIVGYEALTRGPEGSLLELPVTLFEAAREAGRLAELDRASQRHAFDRALEQGLESRGILFLNVQPETSALDEAPASAGARRAVEELRIVLELTERALTERPVELLRCVAKAREAGCRVAIDDVGADNRSLALLPLLRPDVIKLDLRAIHQRSASATAEIASAVAAESERTGALVLAEGIETEADLVAALALGASFGQGFLFGRPVPAPAPEPGAWPIIRGAEGHESKGTPFEFVTATRRTRIATKTILVEISKLLENRARLLGERALVLACFQKAEHFGAASRARYTELARKAAFVGIVGAGLDAEPAPGVHGGALAGGDQLRGEWSVAVVGPHFAAALVAADLGDTGPDEQRTFRFALTHDRALAVGAARSLMSHIAPLH